MDSKPNFNEYNYDELQQAIRYLDREAYPERYQELRERIENFSNDMETTEQVSENVKYHTFWQRLLAAFIDGLLFAAVLYLESFAFNFEYNQENQLQQAFNGLQLALYVAVMQGIWGQTIGKMVTNIKVVDFKSEQAIALKQSFKRESVNLVINSVWISLLLISVIYIAFNNALSKPLIYTIAGFSILALVWIIAEFVTMLLNEKRRSIHDFIGGTVVIRTDITVIEPPQKDNLESSSDS